jgi:regulator of sirC expression with transglutaminase-like and TPR domain
VGRVQLTEEFAELVARPEPEIPLDRASLLIAAHARPELDIDATLVRLDELADTCFAPTLDAVVRHLFVDLGFRGNTADYHDPRNSYLDEVIERRIGIPITLSVLTMEVGRRLGVPLAGVGMPGHFLLRDRVDPSVFVDPFAAGALIDREACRRIFQALHGPGDGFDDAFLEPVGSLTVLARILANLKAIFVARSDRKSLGWVLELRCLIPGMPVGEYRELAEVLASVARYKEAALVLEEVASGLGTDDAARFEARAADYRARLN